MESLPVIVVGVDGSADSARALRWALEEALRRGATVKAVTAWIWDGPEAVPYTVTPAESRARAEAMQEEQIAQALEGLEHRPTVTRVLLEGPAGEVILHVAEGADLIVVGSRGFGRLRSAVLGSVGSHLVRKASCPVVVLPHSVDVPAQARAGRADAAKPGLTSV